jgi:hypothetical protein
LPSFLPNIVSYFIFGSNKEIKEVKINGNAGEKLHRTIEVGWLTLLLSTGKHFLLLQSGQDFDIPPGDKL